MRVHKIRTCRHESLLKISLRTIDGDSVIAAVYQVDAVDGNADRCLLADYGAKSINVCIEKRHDEIGHRRSVDRAAAALRQMNVTGNYSVVGGAIRASVVDCVHRLTVPVVWVYIYSVDVWRRNHRELM